MALLTGESRTANGIAVEDVESYVLRKESFKEVLMANPKIAYEISAIIAQRKLQLDETTSSFEIEPAVSNEVHKSILDRIQSFFRL